MSERPTHIPVETGQVLTLKTEGMGDGADAVARVGGYIVFVAGALPGEVVEARIVAANRKFGRAVLVQVIQPAAERVEPRCVHFGTCGGCHLQHASYPAQLEIKRQRVAKAVKFAAGESVPVAALEHPAEPWGQRGKIVLHVENRPTGYRAGLYGLRSRRLVALDECPAAEPRGFRLAREIVRRCERLRLPAWDAHTGRGCLRGVVVRSTRAGPAGVVLISAIPRLRQEQELVDALAMDEVEGLWLNHNPSPARNPMDAESRDRVDAFQPMQLLGPDTRSLAGAERLREEVAGTRFLLSPTSFFQTSHAGAEILVRKVRAMIDGKPVTTLVDVYCGAGLFALTLARSVDRVIGIEDDAGTVSDARASAAENGLRNVEFRSGPAQALLARLEVKPDVVVLEPPRAGCHAGVLETVTTKLRPETLIYVACDLNSFADDARRLIQADYALDRVEPVDMFPWTQHIDLVARFRSNPQVREGPKRFSRRAGQRLLDKARGDGSSSPDPGLKT